MIHIVLSIIILLIILSLFVIYYLYATNIIAKAYQEVGRLRSKKETEQTPLEKKPHDHPEEALDQRIIQKVHQKVLMNDRC